MSDGVAVFVSERLDRRRHLGPLPRLGLMLDGVPNDVARRERPVAVPRALGQSPDRVRVRVGGQPVEDELAERGSLYVGFGCIGPEQELAQSVAPFCRDVLPTPGFRRDPGLEASRSHPSVVVAVAELPGPAATALIRPAAVLSPRFSHESGHLRGLTCCSASCAQSVGGEIEAHLATESLRAAV